MKLQLLILFGSRARGTAGVGSDADVAVLSDHSLTIAEKAEIAHDVAERLHVSEDKIEVVDLLTASPLMQQQVATEGKLIAGDPGDFLRFKVLAWKRYQDTAKFRRAREQALAQKYGNGE